MGAIKVMASASLTIDKKQIIIERTASEEGEEEIHLYSRSKGGQSDQPPTLSEAGLLELLHQAILAGVLRRDFIGMLRERMEI
jgi:pyruvate formate-lyase activating enzyme-like uncharacterized protein